MNKLNQVVKTGFLVCLMALPVFSQPAWAVRQPAMEQALRHLEIAKKNLQRALPNKGGHRVKAMRDIDRAISQVQKGMQFANRQDNGKVKKFSGQRNQPNKKQREQIEEKERIMLKEKQY